MSRIAEKTPYRDDIQGLRAIAVLLVIADHADVPGLGGGFVGVDVFFVISGFVITGGIWRSLNSAGPFRFVNFYAARARRLLPALSLVMLFTLAAGRLLLSPGEQKTLAATAAFQSVYASNLYFIQNATRYFADDASLNPLLHTWSLSVEEQFYLLWPITLWLCFQWGGRKGLLAGIGGLSLLSFAANFMLAGQNQPLTFFGTPTRVWEFGVGAWLAVVQPRLGKASLIAAAGLALVVSAAMVFDEFTLFPGIAAGWPVAGTVAVIAAGSRANGPTYRLLTTLPFRKIGDWSYSWYLWHWPLLSFGVILWPEIPLGWRLALAGLALLLAAITFTFVEQSVRRWKWLEMRPIAAMVGGAGLALVTVAAAFALRGAAKSAEHNPRLASYAAAEAPMKAERDGCVADFLSETPSPCRFDGNANQRPIVLYGDSHAAQWYVPLRLVAMRTGSPFLVFTKSSCPSVDARGVHSTRLRRQYRECDTWRSRAEAEIHSLRPSIIVLSNFSEAYSSPALRPDGDAGLNRDRWDSDLRATVLRLKAAGHAVVLIRDTPAAGFKVPACLSRSVSRPSWWPSSCTVARAKALGETAWQRESAAVAPLGVHLIDMTAAFCGPVICEPVSKGVVVFRDGNHVTDEATAPLAPDLERIFRTIGP